MSDELKAAIRAAGGIVHSDGNIFFTNRYQFEHAASLVCGTATMSTQPAAIAQPVQPAKPQDAAPVAVGEVRTDQQIVDQTEALAALLASAFRGYEATDGATFRNTEHPKARQCWEVACQIQELLTDTDPENAAAELDVHAPATPAGVQPTPVGDDGDAFRLAVKLGLHVQAGKHASMVSGECGGKIELASDHDGDPYTAARRAITRAAAEVGKGMLSYDEFVLMFPGRFESEEVERAAAAIGQDTQGEG